MSIASMLNQDIERIPFEADATDELGNLIVVWGDPVPLKGYLWQGSTNEVIDDREVAVSTWNLVLGPGEEVSHKDRFSQGENLFEVDGSIHPAWNPRTHSTHHLELVLKLVEEDVEGS